MDDVERLLNFETCHLEWLAVFFSVPELAPKAITAGTSNEEDDKLQKGISSCTRFAVDNLRTQRGDSTPCSSHALGNFPLFRLTLHRKKAIF